MVVFYNNLTRRLSNIATMNGNSQVSSFAYTYDNVGNVTQVTCSCPWLTNQYFTESFTYDASDQLVSLLFLCSPKEKKQKEKALAAVEKNPVHYARQLAERRNQRCGRMQSQACLGYAEPRGEKDAKHLNSQHRSTPLPCYGRRIFSFTPHVAFAALQPTIATSDIFYYHTNHLGSTAYVTDNNATVTQGFLYAPFGEITTEYNATFGNDIIPKYSFNAKELDEETGMYYYEVRYYKPPVFTSRDPMMDQKPWLTPYHYCSNNPVGRVDPSGNMDDWVEKADGTIYWDEKATSPSTTKDGERYLGKKGYDVNTLYFPDGTTRERVHTLKQYNVTDKATEHEKAMQYKHELGIHEGGFSIHPEVITNIIKGFSIDGTLAYGPVGLTLELGIIRDNKSGFSGFFSFGYAMGWEKSFGINAIVIPSSTFKKEDFSGLSWNINASLNRLGLSLTGDIQRGENRDRYSDYYLGGKIGLGKGTGASFSITYTYLFN